MKNDIIPELNEHFKSFAILQYLGFSTALNLGLSKKNYISVPKIK